MYSGRTQYTTRRDVLARAHVTSRNVDAHRGATAVVVFALVDVWKNRYTIHVSRRDDNNEHFVDTNLERKVSFPIVKSNRKRGKRWFWAYVNCDKMTRFLKVVM